jgi:hypothetical protein
MSEWQVRRCYIDALWTMQHGRQCKLEADGPEGQDLLDVANIRLALLDPRRNPLSQEFSIPFDIGGDIERSLAAEGQRSSEPLDHESTHVSASRSEPVAGKCLFPTQPCGLHQHDEGSGIYAQS